MENLITEARELCEYSEKIVNQLHTERLDYELEYMPLIETIQVTSELCDALETMTTRAEKAEAENRWIPVGERLPEDSEPVYAYCPTGRGSVEATMGMMARAHKYSGYTHWMPRTVPEPPKGV